ncbi:hypothetical protein DFJ73DRAFT_867571 [Zopfochytrium polystomum]|nr:hypothetical protein DFJ73DRAFT_867571 [Zopfochytrium polystomum]
MTSALQPSSRPAPPTSSPRLARQHHAFHHLHHLQQRSQFLPLTAENLATFHASAEEDVEEFKVGFIVRFLRGLRPEPPRSMVSLDGDVPPPDNPQKKLADKSLGNHAHKPAVEKPQKEKRVKAMRSRSAEIHVTPKRRSTLGAKKDTPVQRARNQSPDLKVALERAMPDGDESYIMPGSRDFVTKRPESATTARQELGQALKNSHGQSDRILGLREMPSGKPLSARADHGGSKDKRPKKRRIESRSRSPNAHGKVPKANGRLPAPTDVMKNFTSKNIGTGRLTAKRTVQQPSEPKGIFLLGKRSEKSSKEKLNGFNEEAFFYGDRTATNERIREDSKRLSGTQTISSYFQPVRKESSKDKSADAPIAGPKKRRRQSRKRQKVDYMDTTLPSLGATRRRWSDEEHKPFSQIDHSNQMSSISSEQADRESQHSSICGYGDEIRWSVSSNRSDSTSERSRISATLSSQNGGFDEPQFPLSRCFPRSPSREETISREVQANNERLLARSGECRPVLVREDDDCGSVDSEPKVFLPFRADLGSASTLLIRKETRQDGETSLHGLLNEIEEVVTTSVPVSTSDSPDSTDLSQDYKNKRSGSNDTFGDLVDTILLRRAPFVA